MAHLQRSRPRLLAAALFGLVSLGAALPAGCRSAGEPGRDGAAPRTPADELLDRSIAYHDPQGLWEREPVELKWTSLRPNGETSFAVELRLEPGGGFAMEGERRGHEIEYRVEDGEVHARVDGEDGVPAELEDELLLTRDGGLFWRDYLGFLAGLPMCLAYPSVLVEPEVGEGELEGHEVLTLRASFAPEVGTDLWTFYFDPATSALVGCRFDRADPTKDGETIVFEGSAEVGEMRLPATRHWFMNADRRFLGTDEVRAAP